MLILPCDDRQESSGRLYLWEVATGELLRTWDAHYRAVSTLAITTGDAYLISGGLCFKRDLPFRAGILTRYCCEQVMMLFSTRGHLPVSAVCSSARCESIQLNPVQLHTDLVDEEDIQTSVDVTPTCTWTEHALPITGTCWYVKCSDHRHPSINTILAAADWTVL